MPLKLLPATLKDIATFTDIYMISFQDAVALQAFPRNSPSVREWWTTTNEEEFSNPSARFLKVVDDEASDEENIVGWAKWDVPVVNAEGKVEVGGDKPDTLPEWPEGADKELCNEFFGALAGNREKFLEGRGHYFLEIIGVLPEYQGRGAAGQLIRWGLDRADEEGLEAYVEGWEGVKKLYEKFVFESVGEFTVEKLKHTEYFMVRKPRNEDAA